MNAMLKEETRMETPKKTYLELYKEFLAGYRHYKMEKAIVNTRAVLTESTKK